MTPDSLPPEIAAMSALATSEEVSRFWSRVARAANFELPAEALDPFHGVDEWLHPPDPQGAGIRHLRPARAEDTRWHVLLDRSISSAQMAFVGVHYRRHVLQRMNAEIAEAAMELSRVRDLSKTTMALGCTQAMNIEYQDFILGCRRCLDYLAQGISAYFKTNSRNFGGFRKNLAKMRPTATANLVESALKPYDEQIDQLRALRDRISHFEYVGIGTLNVGACGGGGVTFAGGGEKLGMASGLLDALDRYVLTFGGVISGSLTALVDGDRRHDEMPTSIPLQP
jgi:hypothetical protein